ncbi:MAG: suppressor of fused domain protein [Verrucomicrobiales bacterium]
MSREPTAYSESGDPIYDYAGEERPDPEIVTGDGAVIEAISGHIERHLGKVDGVFHEIVSDRVHIDVHIVAPSDERPFYSLVTSGMSDLPMAAPEGAEDMRFAELCVFLPPEWPLSQGDFDSESNYWPIRWLKQLARFPHLAQTWLSCGHTVPNGNPPAPIADTGFTGMMLISPMTAPPEFLELQADGKTIHFFSLMPLFPEEMDFKLKKGAEALLLRMHKKDVWDVIDTGRPNVGRKRWGIF